MTLQLDRIEGTFAMVRLDPGAGLPHWIAWSRALSAFIRRGDETAVVCDEDAVPSEIPAERGFTAYVVRGPLDFSAVGIMARLSAPLADAGVPLLAFSTFDTDVILVRRESCERAEVAWHAAGISTGESRSV